MGYLAVYYRTNREWLVTHVTPFNPNLRTLGFETYANPDSSQGLAILNQIVHSEALMLGYLDDFRTMMMVTLLSIPLIALLKGAQPANRQA